MELDRALHLLYELSHQDLTLCRNCKEHCDENGCIYEQAFDTVHVEILKKQPAAEWIKNGSYYQCSNCLEWAIDNEDHCSVRSKYCPNCGAKMEGV